MDDERRDDDRVVDDRVLDMLSRKIKAEMAHAAAVEESTAETRKLRIAKERQARLLLEIVQKYANLGEQVTGLTELLRDRLETDVIYAVLREWFEDFGREIDRINDLIRLILELVRLVVPQAQRAAIEQIINEPDAEVLHRRILRLLKQLRVVEVRQGPEFELLVEQIMAEIAEVQEKKRSGSSK